MSDQTIVLADDRPSIIGDDLYQWALDAETELRRLHAENEALRHANRRFGQREDWWNGRMFDMEQRYMALVKQVANVQALQTPTITIQSDDTALLRQALEALEKCQPFSDPNAIAALRERLK